MKKALLGLGILGIYGVYSIGVRHQRPTIAKPTSLASTSSGTSSSSNKGYSNSSSSASKSSSSGQSTASSNSTKSSGSTGKSSGSTGRYKDGNYVGQSEDAYYGNVQVSVTISGGRISDVKFLQYPNTHSTSVYINQQVMPYLKDEAIKSQNANNVQIISGATFTSEAFVQSLQTALNKA